MLFIGGGCNDVREWIKRKRPPTLLNLLLRLFTCCYCLSFLLLFHLWLGNGPFPPGKPVQRGPYTATYLLFHVCIFSSSASVFGTTKSELSRQYLKLYSFAVPAKTLPSHIWDGRVWSGLGWRSRGGTEHFQNTCFWPFPFSLRSYPIPKALRYLFFHPF